MEETEKSLSVAKEKRFEEHQEFEMLRLELTESKTPEVERRMQFEKEGRLFDRYSTDLRGIISSLFNFHEETKLFIKSKNNKFYRAM